MIERALRLLSALGGQGDPGARPVASQLASSIAPAAAAEAIVDAIEQLGPPSQVRRGPWIVWTAIAVVFAVVGGALGLRAIVVALELDWGIAYLLPLLALPLLAASFAGVSYLERDQRADYDELASAYVLHRLLAAGADEKAARVAASFLADAVDAELGRVELADAAVRLGTLGAVRRNPPLATLSAVGVGAAAALAVCVFWAMYFLAIGSTAYQQGVLQ